MNHPVMDLFRKTIKNIGVGYYSKVVKIKTQDFGIPQNRTRIFCIARKGKELPENITGELKNAAREIGFEDNNESLKDAIGDLPPLEINDGKEVYALNNGDCKKVGFYQNFVKRNAKILYKDI